MLLVLALISYLSIATSAFFVKPSDFIINNQTITICNSPIYDRQNKPGKQNNIPYFSCNIDGRIKILSCKLILSTKDLCLLNFPGIRSEPSYPNTPTTLNSTQILIDTDCTEYLNSL